MLCVCVSQRATEVRCLSGVRIKEPCPWTLSPWEAQKEEVWQAGETSPVPHWSNRRTWKLPSGVAPFPTGLQEAWACVRREATQQVTTTTWFQFTCVFVFLSPLTALSFLLSSRSRGQRNGNGPTSSHVGTWRLGGAEVCRQRRAPSGTPWYGSRWLHVRADGEPVQ